MATAPLSDPEGRVVDATWAAVSGAPPERDPQAAGCVVALGGMVLLTAVPAFGNFVDLGAGTAYGFLALAVLLLFVGAGLAMGASHARVRAGRREVGRIADVLADPPDREAALREATVLLARARTGEGPVTVAGLAAARVARDLGPGLPVVVQVEQHLVQSGRMAPVFTSDRFSAPPSS